MKPLPRKAKSAAKPIVDDYSSEESDSHESSETNPPDFLKSVDQKVEEVTREESEEEQESATSDFEEVGKKRKRTSAGRRATTKKFKIKLSSRRKREPSPDVPPMSDDEHEEERSDDVVLFENPKKPLPEPTQAANVKFISLPNILRIEVPSGPTTINLNLSDLLCARTNQQSVDETLDGDTLLERSVKDSESLSPPNERAKAPESFVEMRANPKYACFLELEPELRNRIYREHLVKAAVVKFNPTPDLSRNAAILRTSRQVYQEASEILYGENAFHLDRTEKPRGSLYTAWKEVGFKDMRRFLETIGPHNLAKMRFLSISLSDAVPVYSPELEAVERRYYNDPVLHHMFKLIGNSGAVFEKLVVDFGGRGAVEWDNVPFIRAFTTMKCHELIKVCRWHHSRINAGLFSRMQRFMEVPAPSNVNPKKRKVPLMHHQQGEANYLGCPIRCYNSPYNR